MIQRSGKTRLAGAVLAAFLAFGGAGRAGSAQSVKSASSAPSALPEAFSVAERMKARSFLDELGAAKFSRAGAPEELLQEKRLLEARIKWLREKQ